MTDTDQVMGAEAGMCEFCKANKHQLCMGIILGDNVLRPGEVCGCTCSKVFRAAGRPYRIGSSLAEAIRGLLGFEYQGGEYVAGPQRPFRPRGLVIWGAPDRATVGHMLIGIDTQVQVSWTPVPCKFFSMGKSYEDITKLLAEGVEPPNWCSWRTVTVGEIIRLTIADAERRPLPPESGIELCMWGQALLP